MSKPAPALCVALLAAVAAACGGGVTDTGAAGTRIVLDLGELANAATIGNFVHVLRTARLTITDDDGTRTRTVPVGSSDSTVTFDVKAKEGPADFTLDVLNDSNIVLLHGTATTNVTGNGFLVDLHPVATNPILVGSPRKPPITPFPDTDYPNNQSFRYDLKITNRGLDSLRWEVDSLFTAGVQISCFRFISQTSCLQRRALAAGAFDSVRVIFRMPLGATTPPTQGIRLNSNVGSTLIAVIP